MLAPEDLRYGITLGAADPASLAPAVSRALLEVARNPVRTAAALAELGLEQSSVGLDVARRLLDGDGPPVAEPDEADKRFTDRAWTENPFLRGLLQSYLVTSRWARRQLDEVELPELTRRKARFALGVALDALAPTNVPALNPSVVKEAIDTGGLSLVRGASNFLDDLVRNRAQPRHVVDGAFELGHNLAATPGRVVFRNELFELLAYEPQTAEVHATPVVYSPPWINKYYVLDLAPGRSFVEYAVREGFTVFAMSYRNPDETLASATLDDYLRDGVLEAVEQATRLTGADRVGLIGLCVGGTLAVATLAALAARGEAGRVGWAAILNSLVDFGDPGAVGVFTDEESISRIERRIARRGYMEPAEVSGPFTLMRTNELVWRYVVSSWYMGRRPRPFDILAWNADATRLPAAMHAQFLRACYLENRLVRPGGLVLDGTPIDVSRISTPLYVLGAEDDHIVPWRSGYRTTQLVGGEARHTLTSSGHIAGLVKPPGSSGYWSSEEHPPEPERWLERARRVEGSWWEDWSAWAKPLSGPPTDPPALPDGEPAPGSYVRG